MFECCQHFTNESLAMISPTMNHCWFFYPWTMWKISTTSSDTASAATDTDLQRGSSVCSGPAPCISCKTFLPWPRIVKTYSTKIPHLAIPAHSEDTFSKMRSYDNHSWGTLGYRLFNDPQPSIQSYTITYQSYTITYNAHHCYGMQQPVVGRRPGRRKHPMIQWTSPLFYHKLRHCTLQLPVLFLKWNIGYSQHFKCKSRGITSRVAKMTKFHNLVKKTETISTNVTAMQEANKLSPLLLSFLSSWVSFPPVPSFSSCLLP